MRNQINPILIDLPTQIKTSRLILRSPKTGDGKQLNNLILESFDELNKWMMWADHKPSIEESEIEIRKSQAKWILREDLQFLIFDSNEAELLGSIGISRMNWNLRSFEIGYWIGSKHAKQGIITEAANAIVHFAFQQLHAIRVEIRCDEENIGSRKIAEKLNFYQEGILINNAFKPVTQTIRNTVIYAKYNLDNIPEIKVTW